MSITEGAGAAHAAPPPGRIIDARFAKRLVTINGLVPAALLAWDAYHRQLGVNEVNFAIRTTGLVGLVLLVLALLVTPLRKWTGWNQLIAIRRNLGVLAFGYLALHFAIFFALDRAGSVASTLDEIVERVYLWFGAAALVMLIPLAATSTDGMVTRLGARRWKLLHRLAYPIAACAVVHYYLLVKSDVRQPLVFAAITGALLAYRAVRYHADLRAEVRAAHARLAEARARASPRRTWWSGELKIARIFDETHDIRTFRLVAPGGGPLPFDHIAGQYLNLALTIDGKRVNRSYTIASPPTRTAYCEISVKRAVNGHASRHLHDAWREGDLVKVSAPAGRFVFDRAGGTGRAVLIAGGVGITPMMSIVRCLTDRCWPGEIYLMISVRTVRDIAFRDELTALEARFPNLHVRVTLTGDRDPAWTGARGQISRSMVEDFIPDFARRSARSRSASRVADPGAVCAPQPAPEPILVCGPDSMMAAVRRLFVHDLGVPDCNILQEAFVSPPVNASVMPDAAPLHRPPDIAASLDPDAGIPIPADAVFTVKFQRAGKTAELPADTTVLEAAEAAGVAIPFECRAGICGQCKTRLISGTVTMATQDALTAGDRSKGLILACQSRAAGNVVVDA
jgi:ferredoxin-NADP reductase/DMSO/TMAO reductase YedYZ heme-binding membrane subunit